MRTRRHHDSGFTLIELMVTVAIAAILATIAFPSYNEQMRKTRRATARQEMMDLATAQERFYTNCNRFAATLDGAQNSCAGLGRATATVTSDGGYYQISMAATATTYTLTATPQLSQTADLGCANLSLTEAGVKGASGTLGPAACW